MKQCYLVERKYTIQKRKTTTLKKRNVNLTYFRAIIKNI